MYNAKMTTPISQKESIVDISRYFNTHICQEELRLMQEIDDIPDTADLKKWFELLKSSYRHKNIPKRVYLRVTTLLNGYVWFSETEYSARVKAGKPVSKVTPREYALEKQLALLKAD